MAKVHKNIKMAFVPQGKKSANCGPCSIKMVADYYGVKKASGEPYSVHSLNRLLNVSTKWGCEKADMARVLRRLGLGRKKVSLANLKKYLDKNLPILTLLIDEEGGGHYAVIKGIKDDDIIFHDPYWGRNFTRNLKQLDDQLKTFGHWLWAISPSTQKGLV